jgi:hypothetical protein
MHENSVLRITGYVMGSFANGGKPVDPWSLYLNFNKKHQKIKLDSIHFTPDGTNITNVLIKEIESIDPEWRVPGGTPVFMDARTKKQLKIKRKIDYNNLRKEIVNFGKPKEPTFFSIMDQVFENR